MSQTYSTVDVQQPEILLANRIPSVESKADPPLYPQEDVERRVGKSPTFEKQTKWLLGWAGRRCGLSALVPKIEVFWNSRFTALLGRATLKSNKIELSSRLWPFLQDDLKREVLLHEACHLFVYHRHGFKLPHGKEWIETMQKCGYRAPEAKLPCPNDTASKQYLVYCRCGAFFVSPQLLGKKRTGRLYCPKCNSDIQLKPYGD